MQAEASPVMMAALQLLSDLDCGYRLFKVCSNFQPPPSHPLPMPSTTHRPLPLTVSTPQRSQLIGKSFRPVVDLQWLPHSLVDWQLVLDGGCMCNHFCARSALVRKAELYQLLRDARGSDSLPVVPATIVFVLPHNEGLSAADEATLAALFCEQADERHCNASNGISDRRRWLLKAGNSSNGNGIHLITHLEQVASLLRAEQPRGSWCVQEFVGSAALVHGCRYSVRLLLLVASTQVPVSPLPLMRLPLTCTSQEQDRPSFSAWAFRSPIVLRCLVPFDQAQNKRECAAL
jgi:hypothetical protein